MTATTTEEEKKSDKMLPEDAAAVGGGSEQSAVIGGGNDRPSATEKTTIPETNADTIAITQSVVIIEEGSIQKTRQTVVVLDWGARSNAALGIFGVKVYSIVYIAVVQFSFTVYTHTQYGRM